MTTRSAKSAAFAPTILTRAISNGAVPLTLFEILVNAPGVSVDVPLTSSSSDDVVLAPGQSRQIGLVFDGE